MANRLAVERGIGLPCLIHVPYIQFVVLSHLCSPGGRTSLKQESLFCSGLEKEGFPLQISNITFGTEQ